MIKLAKPAAVVKPPRALAPVGGSISPPQDIPAQEPTLPSASDALTDMSTREQPGRATVGDVTHRIGQVTGYSDGWIPGGPLQGFLASTALGAGGGWLASKIWNALGDEDPEEKKQTTRKWSIIGGLLTGVPAAIGSASYAVPSIQQHGISGLFKYPTKSGAVKKAFDWPPQNNMPLFQTVGAIAAANDLSPVSKAMAIDAVQQAASSGQLTFGTLLSGAVGAGLGLMVGSGVARVLDAFVGLPPAGKKLVTTTGLLGGALKGIGLI